MNLRRRYGRKPFTESHISNFCRDLVLENRMKAWALDLADLEERLQQAIARHPSGLDYGRVCELVYESYAKVVAGKTTARLFGDKNPHYALLVHQLLKVFDRARFVHVVRDPRDNVLSYKSVPFDVENTSALAYRWRAYNQHILRAQRAAPDRFLRIRYEDLLAEPEHTLQELCQFLGLSYESSMLGFFEEHPSNFYGEGSAWFGNLGRPLDTAQANKWQSQLASNEVADIEAICGQLLTTFGYSRVAADRPLRQLLRAPGIALGVLSVLAEQATFAALPPELRIEIINRYRKQSGRV